MNYKYLLVFLFSVFISSISQIGLKKSSKKQYSSIFYEYCNLLVITSYLLLFIAMFLTFFALRYIPLSFAPVLESAGYIFVTLLSKIFLKETITVRKLFGMFVIIMGILVYSL